jgi:hypothetical protein
MEQLNDDAVEQPVDDVVGQPVVTKSDMGFEVIDTPWWVVLLEGVIAIIAGLFLLYQPVITTILLNTNSWHFLASRRNSFCYGGADISGEPIVEVTFRYTGHYSRNRYFDVSCLQSFHNSHNSRYFHRSMGYCHGSC